MKGVTKKDFFQWGVYEGIKNATEETVKKEFLDLVGNKDDLAEWTLEVYEKVLGVKALDKVA